MLTVSIREVTPGDAERWLELRCALWPGSDADHAREIAAYFGGALEEPDEVLFAEIDNNAGVEGVVGVAELSIRAELVGTEGQPVGYVEGLYVIPSARHQGVGRQLLIASREWAKRKECRAFASDRGGRVVIDRRFPR